MKLTGPAIEYAVFDYLKGGSIRRSYSVKILSALAEQVGETVKITLYVFDLDEGCPKTFFLHRICVFNEFLDGEVFDVESAEDCQNALEMMFPNQARLLPAKIYYDERDLREIVERPQLDANNCIAGFRLSLPWPAFMEALDYSFEDFKRNGKKQKFLTRGTLKKFKFAKGDVLHFDGYPDGSSILQVSDFNQSVQEMHYKIYARIEGRYVLQQGNLVARGYDEIEQILINGP